MLWVVFGIFQGFLSGMYHSSSTRSPASLPWRKSDRSGRLLEGCGGKNGCRRTAERVKLVPQSKECEGGREEEEGAQGGEKDGSKERKRLVFFSQRAGVCARAAWIE